MRISTSQFFQQSVDAMLRNQRDLSQTELQVASGKRILKPSDDASASVRVMSLNESQKQLAQYQRNADMALAKLDQEEVALNGIVDLLQAVRELAVRGSNGTQGISERQSIAAEVRQHLDSFVQLANTQDSNGEYVFSGYKTHTASLSHDGVGNFTYHGDNGQRKIQIGDNREVAINDPGTIFMDFPAAAGGTTNIGKVIYDLATSLEAGNPDLDALTDIDTAFTDLFDARSKVGARMNAIEDQKTANDAFDLALADVRSTLEDLDYAEALSRFNQQLTALQASQQAFIRIQDLNLFNFIR